MGKFSDRAGNRFLSGAVVAQARFKDNGGSGRAESFDVEILAVNGENRVSTNRLLWGQKYETCRQQDSNSGNSPSIQSHLQSFAGGLLKGRSGNPSGGPLRRGGIGELIEDILAEPSMQAIARRTPLVSQDVAGTALPGARSAGDGLKK
jgi:hypothetical protein